MNRLAFKDLTNCSNMSNLPDDLKRKKSFSNSFALYKDQENINQQVKRLKLTDTSDLCFSSLFAESTKQISESIKHRFKSNFNEDTSDSGLGTETQNMDCDLDYENLDSDIEEESNHPKVFKNKLLDISNCSLSSPSPYTSRRCLFKQTPTPQSITKKLNLSTPNKCILRQETSSFLEEKIETKQITPISSYRNSSLLQSSFLDFSFEKGEKNQSEEEEDNSNMKDIHKMIMQSLDYECQSVQQNSRLIGDRSSTHLLPCTNTIKHNDLSVITPLTFKKVLDGHYDDQIGKLLVIDARYPYEFEGGHIKQAKNIFTKERLMEMFFDNKDRLFEDIEPGKRLIIIFHCEFSSERGPGMLRFLRNQDRAANKNSYPKLFYPELYLLEGGYKAFYESTAEYCEPREYKPMLHQDHVQDLKHFRAKAKTWENQYKHSICSSTFKSTTRSRVVSMSSRFQRFQSNLF